MDIINPVKASRCTIKTTPKNAITKLDNKAIKSIDCPTFFIFGELDKMVKVEKGKEFASLIKKSKMHIIKNCGHMVILENAFEMREKMINFLKNEKISNS